jgi:membrane fusion protein, multidrug efflux system
MFMIKRHSLCFLLATIGAFLFFGCEKPHTPPPRVVKVRTDVATQENVPLLVRGFGTLVANYAINIIPQVSATLMKKLYDDGTLVPEGTLLYVLDQRSFLADLQKAQAEVVSQEIQLKIARDVVFRSEPLLVDQLISAQDFENLVASVDQTQENLNRALAELALAEINLGYTEIRATTTGIIGINNIDEGNYVIAGQSKLTTLNNIDPIFADCWIPAYQFSAIQKAFAKGPLALSVRPMNDPNSTPVLGTLVAIGNNIDTKTSSFEIRGAIPNADMKLWSGEFVTFELTIDTIQDAVLIDQAALGMGKSGPYVFVIDETTMTAALRQVTIIEDYQGKVVVSSGLKAGEVVVTLGQMNLKNGDNVVIDNTVNSLTAVPSSPIKETKGAKPKKSKKDKSDNVEKSDKKNKKTKQDSKAKTQ